MALDVYDSLRQIQTFRLALGSVHHARGATSDSRNAHGGCRGQRRWHHHERAADPQPLLRNSPQQPPTRATAAAAASHRAADVPRRRHVRARGCVRHEERRAGRRSEARGSRDSRGQRPADDPLVRIRQHSAREPADGRAAQSRQRAPRAARPSAIRASACSCCSSTRITSRRAPSMSSRPALMNFLLRTIGPDDLIAGMTPRMSAGGPQLHAAHDALEAFLNYRLRQARFDHRRSRRTAASSTASRARSGRNFATGAAPSCRSTRWKRWCAISTACAKSGRRSSW